MIEECVAVREISAALDSAYPPAFLAEYSLIECLAAGHGTETFLVCRKVSGEACVAKCYDRSIYPLALESSILKSLRHDGIPEFRGEFRDDRMICVIRQYVEGTPLDRFMAYNAPSKEKIIDLCARLLDILTYLHGLEKPVIHRDIKPQNIIVKPDGGLALIDFDIAREYNEASETDTRFLGTRIYAPPEQYGFSQTDCRTDLFAFGVLLRWLLTGETGAQAANVTDMRLDAVIRRCTAFSPEDRYISAAQVKRALLNTDRRRNRAAARTISVVAAILICLCAGFAAGRYTGLFAVPAGGGAMQFREPLMERAVRAQLGIGADGLVTVEDLASIQAVYIFGNEVAASDEAFAQGLSDARKNDPRGSLETLADVRLLPNLETLYVNYQELSDISPLSQLQNLTNVNLRHTRVADISALSGMESLENVNLYDTNVKDVSCLDACPRLAALDVGRTLIPSLGKVGGGATLRTLSLKDLNLLSLDGIDRFVHLEELFLSGTGIYDLTPLNDLANLRKVVLDGVERDGAGALESAAFEIAYE
jgi:predicted Ser/Thr protein kinase